MDSPDRDAAAPTALAGTWWEAGSFAFLIGPPIGFLLTLGAGRLNVPFGGIGGGVGFVIVGAFLSYFLYGLPAFVAGALFRVWRRYVPSLVLSLIASTAIGFVVTCGYQLLVFGENGALDLALAGAATGLVYAAWLEYLWRRVPA